MLNNFSDVISISSWNVNGLGQKHRDNLFLDHIKCDIHILLETWKGESPDIKIPNYGSFSKCRTRKKKARRNSGGIIVYFKNHLKKGIEYLVNSTESKNRMWIKLDKTFFSIDKDLYICGIYIPPLNSPHYVNEYETLESEINLLSSKGHILLMGDLNSRTSANPDFILYDGNNENICNLLPENYKSDYFMPRKSQDKILNSQGKELLDLCVSAQLRILNGRFIGDLLGNITCLNQRGNSIVDYAVASESLLSSVKYFTVKNPNHFSDHNQLVTHLKCGFKLESAQNKYMKQQYSLKWTKVSKILLEKELSEKYIYESISGFQTTDFENSKQGVNLANDMISNIYLDLSKKCMRTNYFKKKKNKRKTLWSDSEFLSLRSTVNELSKKIKLSPFDQLIKSNFLYYAKKFKKLTKFKKREYKKTILNKISNLSPKESKEFWKLLRSIDGKYEIHDDHLGFDLNSLAEHFRSQGNPEKIDTNFEKHISEKISLKEKNLKVQNTDQPITISEIKEIIKKLKKGKSSGPDLICYEIIKYSSSVMLTSLAKIFNLILETSFYPDNWNKSFIIPLFKGGDQTDPSNYRGISLMNCLSKIFNSVINNRLLIIFKNKINPSQFGFTRNSRTTDSLFILKTLINKYVNSEKQKIFGCFVDLKKAFDSVWRLGLLYKIIKEQTIGIKLYNVIKGMYMHTEASVKSNENLSNYVQINRGVKQGDSLSPTLFNLYINDLPDIFDKNCCPIALENMSINCLMFADDLLLLSETPEGLQKSLDNLNQYCRNWQLSVNVKKTKVIIFQQKNIPYTKSDFFINGKRIDKVLNYKYLGNIIESSGKFHACHSELSKKGIKVLFSMFKYLNPIENLSLKIFKKLFDALIKPILTYNAEIWYLDFYEKIIKASQRAKSKNANFDILTLIDSSNIEKVNLKFCKFVMGLSKQAVNIAARAELAQYPLDVFIKAQVLKYFARISKDENNPLIYDAFCLSKSLHSKGIYTWYTFVENICNSNNIKLEELEVVNFRKEKFNISKKINRHLKEEYEKKFFEKLQSLNEKSKIFLYSRIKTKYDIDEYYLKTTFENRKNVTKMKISDHYLEVERGRYKRIKREDRICQFCDLREIDDENHFFFSCSKNSVLRNNFITNIKNANLENKYFKGDLKLEYILSISELMQLAAPFIKQSFALRKVDSTAAVVI